MDKLPLDEAIFSAVREHISEPPTNAELIAILRILAVVNAQVTEEFIDELEDRAIE